MSMARKLYCTFSSHKAWCAMLPCLAHMQDGANIAARPRQAYYSHALLKPYVVFDVSAGRDAAAGRGKQSAGSGADGQAIAGSRWNLAEVNLALALFQALRKTLLERVEAAAKKGGFGPAECRVGILSPYRRAFQICAALHSEKATFVCWCSAHEVHRREARGAWSSVSAL